MNTDTGDSQQPPGDGPPPIRINRRTLLLGLGALTAIGAVGYWITEGQPRNPGATFATPIRIPPLLESEIIDGERVFRLTAQAGETELVPGAVFATMGFNGTHLGPTIRAARGERVRIHVTNDLTMPTTAHWHGMILPASQDGTAHQSIKPEATWTAAWQIDQPATTLWYHPHPHGQTELQVSRGMAGLFLIDDDASSALPSEYGVDDIPLIIQDVTIQSGRTLPGTPITAPIGRIGNTVIVNGTHQPRFQASTSLVRFRILNASAARCYNLELATRVTFYLVGTDGGLLPSPEPLTSLLLSPAERAEVLIPVPRDADLVLRSVPHDLGMSHGDNITSGAEDTLGILRITRAADATTKTLPVALSSTALPERKDTTTERHFTLGNTTINGKSMDMSRIDTVITANSTETWTISNSSDRAHNFHIHGTQFAVNAVNGAAPEPQNRGWKDTIFIAPGDTAELIVPFSSFADPSTPYMYHCHMLWHEDQGMMAQYVLTDGEHQTGPLHNNNGESHH
ncbi:multicopper oxidase family protein [Glaciibacter superstes]|uniref:multicopper oxidase family protein n=1 Tax=Glaciibacter superstes TaxID=501023 RepID=UPI0003B648A4|nr:multicopper oxidase domain-containing protein [Glaciibacter superstes]